MASGKCSARLTKQSTRARTATSLGIAREMVLPEARREAGANGFGSSGIKRG